MKCTINRVEVFNPSKVSDELYLELFGLAIESCEDAFDPAFNAREYIGDFDRFVAAHRYPNIEVVDPNGRRYNNQEYHHSRLFVAKSGSEVVGWAMTSHNVSGGGSPEEPHNTSIGARVNRGLKRLPTFRHNYLYLPEVFVAKDQQDKGIASEIIYQATGLRRLAFPTMPMAAYAYKGIYKAGKLDPAAKLEDYGFWVTNPDAKPITVQGLGEVVMQRLQNDSASNLHRVLKV